MPLDLIFISPGNYTLGDDGIPGNNTSVIRDGTGAVMFTFAHPADSVGFTASVPGVTVAVDFTDALGAANFTMGSLTNPAVSFASIAMDNVRTTGVATLVSNGAITEFGSDSGADIVASQVILSAGNGIGTASNAVETRTSAIEAETNTGDIALRNFGSVQIGGISGDVNGLGVTTSGNINFSTVGTILLADETGAETVHGGTSSGNVTLTAIGFDSDIIATTNQDAINAAGGNIVLNAGRDIGFGIIGANFDNDVRARGNITINAGRDFLVDGFSDVVSDGFAGDTGGNLVVNAGRNIHLRNVAGTDAGLEAAGSGGADVILTTGSGGSVILDAPTPTAVLSRSGDVVASTDRMLIASASGITASAGQVTLGTARAGHEIDLGSASDTGFALELSDAELDRIFTPTLTIGNDATGRLTVSSAITPANAQNLVLRSGEDIVLQAGITANGSLELHAGDSLSTSATIAVSGSLSIFVDTLGNDGGAGGFVYIDGPVLGATSIAINGAGDNDTLGGFEGREQTVHGNGGDDTINSSGEGHYFGDAGNDLFLAGLSGGGVSEILDGGSGVDTVDTRSYAGNYVINLAAGVTGFDYENFFNFENVITGAGNDQIIGTAGVNLIDTGAGNDILNGGAGADTMRGMAGNDTYYVDNAGDIADESVSGSDGFDRVNSSVSFNLSDGIHFMGAIEMGVLLGTGNLNIAGNALNNILIGNSGANIVNGAGGNDVMRGMAGNDTYYVNGAGDIVDEGIAGSNGFDRVNSSVSINMADGVHFLGGIEMGVLLGAGNVNVVGNAMNNLLIGNSGNNVVNGAGGNDVMRGMAGNDTYIVANAGDIVDESVAGSNGFDRINSALTVNLWDASHVMGTVEMAVLTGAANVNAAGNAINNLIVGNAGANVLNGGFGNDTLTGGAGADTFFFSTALNAANNVDTIDDFSVPADTIRLENSIFTGLAAGALAATAFHIGAAAADAFDRIVYNSTTGALIFDANGNAAGGAIQFATLATGLGLTNADFVVV
jgi:Ca2+-binding RTX toxin-like protein